MKLRAVQLSPVLGSLSANMHQHRRAIAQAKADGIELVVFPELSLSGYQLKDMVYECALRPDCPEIAELAGLSRDIAIIVGAPFEELPGIIYNAALCFSGGALAHVHRKVQLPNHGMFEERMIFKPGDTFRTFKLGPFTVGILICREILFPALAYLYFIQHTDLLIGISNSPFRGIAQEGFSSFHLWENMGYTIAQFFQQNYLFVNRCGFEDGIGFGGGSFYAEANRGIVAKAPSFETGQLDAVASLDAVRRARISANYLRDEQPELVLRELERILHAGH
jgi:predicted amidohydrolase